MMVPAYAWQIPLWTAAAVVLLYLAYRAARRMRLDEEAQLARQREQFERQRQAHEVDEDGRPLCAVCMSAHAVAPYPMLARSRLDRDWFGHRGLHGQSPMYVIRAAGTAPRLCASHKRLLVRKLQTILAEIAARRSAFNAAVDEELAEWEQGKLLVWAQTEAQAVAARLVVLAEPLRKQLPPASVDVTPLPAPTSMRTVVLEPDEPPP